MTLSLTWTNCWSPTKAACGTTILKLCKHGRDCDFYSGLAAGRNGSAPWPERCQRRNEHPFRNEIDSKGQQQLAAIQEWLKKEFQETSPRTTSTSAPAASRSPKE